MVQVRIDSWRNLKLAIDLFESFWVTGEELKAKYPKADGNIDPKAKYLNFDYQRTDLLNLAIWEWDWNEISANNVKFDTANLNNAGGSVLINRTVLDTGSPFAINDSSVQLNIS